MNPKGKKLFQKSQLGSTQHISPSSSPTTLTPYNCFTENSFSWLWSSPGCVQALPLCPVPPLCPWSFLPAHQKMPAKSFGSSGSAASAAHPGTDFSWKTWFWHISQGDECRVKSYSADLDNVIRWRQMIFKQAFPLILVVDFFQLKKKKERLNPMCAHAGVWSIIFKLPYPKSWVQWRNQQFRK